LQYGPRAMGLAAAFALVCSALASTPGCGGSEPRAPAYAEGQPLAPGDLDFARKAGGPAPPEGKAMAKGIASWYGEALAGRKTASGESFDTRGMTAAHRTLPFGTWVEVRRLDTNRSVRVRINDRGPFRDTNRRIIDVSKAAADALDFTSMGMCSVEIRVVRGP
jgi:rare lipoprotein A